MRGTLQRSRHSPQAPSTAFEPSRSRWPALLGSLIAHATVIFSLLWLFAAGRGNGTTAPPTVRSVGMAIAHRMPDRTRYITEPDELRQPSAATTSMDAASPVSTPSVAKGATGISSEMTETVEAIPSLEMTSPIDLAAVLAEMSGAASSPTTHAGAGTSTSRSDALVHGNIRLADGRSPNELGDHELVPGIVRAGQGAGQTTTEVFGIAGSGSTFVYVFDRSESMSAAGSAPLRAAKSELIRSLETLTERQQFQIIFFNHTPDMFHSEGDATGLVLGSPATIERARKYVRQTIAIGGTEHEPALRLALRLAPDVIFFLTDAEFPETSSAQLDDITRRAADAGTTIHAIQFGTGPKPANTFLEQLVRRGGGGYRYVDVTKLK